MLRSIGWVSFIWNAWDQIWDFSRLRISAYTKSDFMRMSSKTKHEIPSSLSWKLVLYNIFSVPAFWLQPVATDLMTLILAQILIPL